MQFTTTEARDEHILQRHYERATLRDIGKEVGLSHEGVRKVIQKTFEQSRKIEIVRMIQAEGEELAREAMHHLRQTALDPDVSAHARNGAWAEYRLMWESVRKLYGADEPTKRQEVTDTSTWEAQLLASIAASERENERRAAQANRE